MNSVKRAYKRPSSERGIGGRHALYRNVACLLLVGLAGCGYHEGIRPAVAEIEPVKPPGRARHTIAIPIFENATFEPILEKPISQIFKETFFSRGWDITGDPKRAAVILKGRINRYERFPISLNPQGQAKEYRIKIGLQLRLHPSEGAGADGEKTFVVATEGSAEYIARSDPGADRIAENRAIREAGRRMAEEAADFLLARISQEGATGQ